MWQLQFNSVLWPTGHWERSGWRDGGDMPLDTLVSQLMKDGGVDILGIECVYRLYNADTQTAIPLEMVFARE